MTCYQRHMTWLFEELDLPYEKAERRAVDDALRELFGLEGDAHCPEVWAAIEALGTEERAGLARRVDAILVRP